LELERIPEHEIILKATEPTVLVTGRPGRGKTTLAMRLADTFLSQATSATQSVLFLTFSRNAAYQIRQVSYRHFPLEHQRLWIATYHSFMWWLLTSFGRYNGLPPTLTVVGKTSARSMGNNYQKMAQDLGVIPYAGFAPLALSLLERAEWLRTLLVKRFPWIIVDEFQDTSSQQWELVRLISSGARLVCFADPDQMIYRWQGASDRRLAEVLQRPGAAKYPMQSRCLRTANDRLLAFAESVLDDRPGDAQARREYRERFLAKYQGATSLGYWLKDQIRKFHADYAGRRPGEYPTIAVAAHSNNDVKRIVEALAHPTPKAPKVYRCSTLDSDDDDYLTDLLLSLIHANVELDQQHLHRALQLVGAVLAPDPARASGPIASLLEPRLILQDPSSAKATAKVVLTKFQEVMFDRSESLADALTKSSNAIAHLREQIRGINEAVREDLLTARTAELSRIIASLPPGSTVDQTAVLKARVAAERVRQTVMETTLPPRGIVASTLHKLKGREFDYVCIVAKSGDSFSSKGGSELDARRLLYVGLTRARLHATILYVPSDPPQILRPYLE